MTDQHDLSGEWVEIAEEGSAGRIVLRRQGPDIPPSRAGRRHLHLHYQGEAGAEAPGPTDKSEHSGTGGWSRDGNILEIRVPGWEGKYDIETAQDSTLILRRR